MSLILAGLLVASASGAAFVGGWLARRRAGAEKDGRDGTDGGEPRDSANAPNAPNAKGKAKAKAIGASEPPSQGLLGFPCQLGDVVMRMTGEEAWLAGGVVFSEEMPVAVLFVAPEAGHDLALYVRPAPRETLFWLEPLDPGAVLVGGEPPSSVEHDGIRFDRERRLPLRLRRLGVGAPDLGDTAIVAEYASAGSERLVVLKGSTGKAHAYRGVELDASSYEVIASGRSTLE